MSAVKNRQVWYFHGFDPASTGRYRRIFAAAAQRLDVTIGDLPDDGDGWQVRRDGVVTDIHYCRYEDLVRAAQQGSVLTRIGRGVRTVAGYAADGALWRMARLGPRALALMLTPLWVAFGPLALAAMLTTAMVGQGPVSLVILAAVAIVSLVALDRLYLTLVADLFAYMRALARGGGDAVAHADRVAGLADAIDPQGADEVLLVGHSLGGVAAILAADRVLERIEPGRTLSLLTLGSVHGIVLIQKGEGRDRLAAAIARLTGDARVVWVDVSAPRDAFCLPLRDPLTLIDAKPGMTGPLVISARLRRVGAIPGDRRTVFAAMRRHMGYLLAAEQGAGFDYADTVTGRQSLAARFALRGNSPRAVMWHG